MTAQHTKEPFLYPNAARFPVKFDVVDDIVPHVASLFLDASKSLNMDTIWIKMLQ